MEIHSIKKVFEIISSPLACAEQKKGVWEDSENLLSLTSFIVTKPTLSKKSKP